MNKQKIYILAFILFTGLVSFSTASYAQNNNGGDTGGAVAAGGTNTNLPTDPVTIDWTEIESAIAPLEEVRLPEPQLTTGVRGERQIYLLQGQTAPWSGVLLNPAAVAFIVAETRASYARARLAISNQRELDTNRLHLEVNNLQLQIRSDRQQADVVISGLNREVSRMQRIHTNYVNEMSGGFWRTKIGSFIKWGFVIVGSVAAGIVIGYIAHP